MTILEKLVASVAEESTELHEHLYLELSWLKMMYVLTFVENRLAGDPVVTLFPEFFR